MLKHHGTLYPWRHHRLAVKADAAFAGGDKACQHAQQRGFAAAGRPQRHHQVAFAQLQRNVLQRRAGLAGVRYPQIVCL